MTDNHGPLGEPPEPELSEWAKDKAKGKLPHTKKEKYSKTIDHDSTKPGIQDKPTIGKAERAWHFLNTNMVVKRAGKVLTGFGLMLLLKQIGISEQVAVGTGLAYMPIEKAANVKAEAKTGKPQNFDILTLIFKIVELIIKTVRGKR